MLSTVQTKDQPPLDEMKSQTSLPLRNFWVRLALWLGPDLILLACAILGLAGLVIGFGGRFNLLQTSVLLPAGVLLLFVGTRALVGIIKILRHGRSAAAGLGRGLLQTTRDWIPFALLVLVYENLHEYTGLIRTSVIDEQLMRFDVRFFGIDGRGPTEWMQTFITPWFTEYMAFTYALYFVFPLILCVLLYAQHRSDDFRQVVMAIVLTFYIGFIGYIVFPAVGPRIYIPKHYPEQYTVTLHGALGFYDWSALMWDRLQRVSCDAFPSLHTASSATALYFAFRFGDVLKPRWLLGAIYTPLVISLLISTIYLRQHWVVDVLAGLVLTAGCCWLSTVLRRFFAKLALPA